MNKTKRCSICKEIKPIAEFSESKTTKDGYRYNCKECGSTDTKKWRLNNLEKDKESHKRYYKEHPDKMREYRKKWKLNNKKAVLEEQRRRYNKNPEKFREVARCWFKNNPEKAKEISRKTREKIASTERGVLNNRIASSIYRALKQNKAGRRWESLVGYTVEDLKTHIEKKFTKGMTWNRLMSGEIHIDHKIPKSAFNYESSDDLDFKKCWNLKNLRPMWAKDNLIKSDKLEKPFQPSLLLKGETWEK